MKKKAIIIGAGPAGLTAAYELLKRTDITPVILEKSGDIGGISKTIEYKGNRMDMGPHRFFSKSDRVMEWWLKIMPLAGNPGDAAKISYQNKTRDIDKLFPRADTDSANMPDKVMLIIKRLTRIYFLRKFFAYPIQLSLDTLRTLGFIRTVRILFSFLSARFFPYKPEKSLEDFIINKFGKELYLLFFKDYTEKVWGMAPGKISAEWGAQRIKGVSLGKAIEQAVRSLGRKKKQDLAQKDTETSLIEQFLYPKYGPGSLWEEVARQIVEMGGKIYFNQDVQKIEYEGAAISAVSTTNSLSGLSGFWTGDYFFSSMPVKELVTAMGENVPGNVREVAAGLQYRDFINVGILLKQLSAPENDGGYRKLDLKDNWIYIQERDVKVGRLMIYNNWGDGMIKDPNTTWIGMEYFCNKTDDFWALCDLDLEKQAIEELEKMELARAEDVLDATVRRMEKTYPAYFGTYERFGEIRSFTDQFANLFLVGRNGMHKYNNADHSMLTAMASVDNIAAGVTDKANLWAINTEQEYHEEKAAPDGSIVPDTAKDTKEQTAKSPTAGLQWRPGFLQFIWRDKWNRAYLLTALFVYLVQFIIFKTKYPFANYMPDSYSYLDAAARNLDVNMWPVAYSKFLRLFSVFSHSDKVLVFLQYFLLQGGRLILLFTIFFLLRPKKIYRNVLCVFFLIDPVSLYIANYISSDAIFITLSLLWLSTLVWIIYIPRKWQLYVNAFLLFGCFSLRYNGIYYPFISALAYYLSYQKNLNKIIGIGLGTCLIVLSILYTSYKMQSVTGSRQFSSFGGWQMANNALYMYQNISPRNRYPMPSRFSKLESMVEQHFDTLYKVKITKEDSASSYFYLWNPKGPLVRYAMNASKSDSSKPYFIKWASVGNLYGDYAKILIQRYPIAFLKYFLLGNLEKFAVPPAEFLGVYNMNSDSVGELAKAWFNYKSRRISEKHLKNGRIYATYWVSTFAFLANIFLLLMTLGVFTLVKRKFIDGSIFKFFLLGISLWLVNATFSVFAAPVVIRYQIFPTWVAFLIGMLLFELIVAEDGGNTYQTKQC